MSKEKQEETPTGPIAGTPSRGGLRRESKEGPAGSHHSSQGQKGFLGRNERLKCHHDGINIEWGSWKERGGLQE